MNPFYGGPMNFLQAFQTFAQNFQQGQFGAQQAVDMLRKSGKMTDEQYSQLSQQAQNMMQQNPGLNNLFGRR